jgi:hypothetical protein
MASIFATAVVHWNRNSSPLYDKAWDIVLGPLLGAASM